MIAPADVSPDVASAPEVALKPQGCTNLKLRQLMRRVGRFYDAELAGAGLKTTQYSLLTCLAKKGPMRPADLAKLLKMEASTLTRNVQPTIAAGWVEQSAGPDGRSRMLTLTEAGREKRQLAQRRWRVAQEQLNQLLGVERVIALHQLVDESLALLSPEAVEAFEEL
ncbi:MarR family winged helix-turn-helix transcriptional regulator [Variovorax sp. HJSM1_2]|uniref:MarR family winged helix-turn-helix transcriptional regulator n=1 Tax=Variovorax sp. HJSM1_2 TaxID=3366263 RepID=UPI003BCA4B71